MTVCYDKSYNNLIFNFYAFVKIKCLSVFVSVVIKTKQRYYRWYYSKNINLPIAVITG